MSNSEQVREEEKQENQREEQEQIQVKKQEQVQLKQEQQASLHDQDGCTAAEVLVKCLEKEGVEYVFGIPGEENLDMMNALEKSNIAADRNYRTGGNGADASDVPSVSGSGGIVCSDYEAEQADCESGFGQ